MRTSSGILKDMRVRRGLAAATGILIAMGVVLAVSGLDSQSPPHFGKASAHTLLPATVRPHTFATLSSEFPGRVTTIRVAPGVSVKSGESLLTLADPEFEMEYERAKTRVDDIQERLHNNVLNFRDVEGYESEAQVAHRALLAARERLNNFSLDGAQGAFDKAAARVAELHNLVKQQLATDVELEDAKNIEAVELRNLRADREHLSRLEEEVQLAQQKASEAQNSTSRSGAEDLNLRTELRDAQESLRIATERIKSQTIRSTVSGTVLRMMVNTGDQIPSGIPLVQVGQLDQLDFDVPADATLARSVRVGETVNVRVPTEPPVRISASISDIILVPAQDQSAYTVRITAHNPSPSTVLVGLAAEVEFPHAEAQWHVFPF